MTIKELIDSYGLAELNTRTRISNDNLLNLLNEDYDAVGKANGLGFLKIIEREFDVDLSSEKEKLKTQAKDASYVPKELLVTERKYKTGKKFAGGAFLFTLFAIGLVYVVYLINSQNGTTSLQNPTQTSTQPIEAIKQSTSQEPPEIVEAFSDENTTNSEQNQSEQNVTTVQEPKQIKPVEQNSSKQQVVVVEDALKEDTNNSSVQKMQEEQEQEPQTIAVFEDIQTVVIEPKKKLWLGTINLDTGQRVQKNKIEPITIDSNNTIIVTGHGWLDVAGKEFMQGQRLYFHFVDNRLKQLNKSAFKALNEGKLW